MEEQTNYRRDLVGFWVLIPAIVIYLVGFAIQVYGPRFLGQIVMLGSLVLIVIWLALVTRPSIRPLLYAFQHIPQRIRSEIRGMEKSEVMVMGVLLAFIAYFAVYFMSNAMKSGRRDLIRLKAQQGRIHPDEAKDILDDQELLRLKEEWDLRNGPVPNQTD